MLKHKKNILNYKDFTLMKKNKWILFFLIFGFIYANENPLGGEQNASIVTPAPFVRGDAKFNSNARILKSISFNYINLDGTEDTLVLDVNKSIDWHDTYTIMRSKSPEPSKILDVSVTIPKGSADANLSMEVELPIQSGSIDKLLTYSIYKNKIRLNANDELMSDFSIGNPSKIVMDFKSEQISPSKIVRIKNSFFKRLDFGSHKGYYRLVLYLDGKYNYKIEKDASGYTIFVL